MTGVELFYVELNDPQLNSNLMPDVTHSNNAVLNRVYDQSSIFGGKLTSFSQRVNPFTAVTPKY